MNQHHRRRVYIAGFLVMDANAVNIDEARMLRMKNDFAALVPIGVAWSKQKLAGYGKRRSTRDPVSFLHLCFSRRFTHINADLICVRPRPSAAKVFYRDNNVPT